VEPVKVPQHLELEDVIAWGLEAVDLMWVAAGAAAGWWLYAYVAADLDVRIAAATPVVIAGLALGTLRIGDLALREWIALAAHFALRPRRLLVGGEQ
jgi:hypothetical protein